MPNVPAGTYQGSCGDWVMVSLVREAEFRQMCEVLGLPDLSAEPRFADFAERARNRDALLPIVREAFLARTVKDWVGRFQAERMLCDRVNTPLDWLADPHVRAVNAAVPLEQPGLGTLPFPVLPGLGPWSVPAPGARRAHGGGAGGTRPVESRGGGGGRTTLAARLFTPATPAATWATSGPGLAAPLRGEGDTTCPST